MKKLTKTQKNILKKKVLRISNIVALIVGGLSFAVVLYAIIAGSLNSSAPETSEISEEVPAPSPLVQPALQPPANYDLKLSPYLSGVFYWQDNQYHVDTIALFEENIATIDYYTNSYDWRDMTITTNVYAPTTTHIENEYDMFAFQGDYLGSVASSPAFSRFSITLDNSNGAQAFLFYADFSSSGVEVSANVFLNNLGHIMRYSFLPSLALRGYYVPSFSKLVFSFLSSTNSGYLDALYIDDIGATAYETGFDDGLDFGDYGEGYDDGFDAGYGDGMTDGYDIGRGYGFNEGFTAGNDVGYDQGHTVGYNEGYADGVGYGSSSSSTINNAFDLIYAGAQSIDKILSIHIFGPVNLGMLLFTPLIVGISLSVIKIIKG